MTEHVIKTSAGAVPPRAFAVLGMHRSGTSALTGSLAEAGAYLGDVLDASLVYNRKGLQEPAALVYMHENLLQANGGSWDNPPKTIEWRHLHKTVRDLFLESRRGKEPWIFKDPRTLLVLEGWLDAHPELAAVGIFRDPLSVARSLQHRNGFSLLKGLSLWQAYNDRLLYWTRERGIPVIEFSTRSEVMRARLAAVTARLGLSFPPTAAFYDADLPSAPPETAAAPAEIDSLYRSLKECALDPAG